MTHKHYKALSEEYLKNKPELEFANWLWDYLKQIPLSEEVIYKMWADVGRKQDSLLSKRLEKIREEVERVKEDTRSETGSFKFDACYDEVLALPILTHHEK